MVFVSSLWWLVLGWVNAKEDRHAPTSSLRKLLHNTRYQVLLTYLFTSLS